MPMNSVKHFFFTSFFLISYTSVAQLSEVQKELKRFVVSDIDTIEGWSDHGELSLTINQAAYLNWQSGEANSVGFRLNAVKRYNYTKGDFIWDNLILANYGMTRLSEKGWQKTDDRIEVNSIIGAKIPENWTYSFFVNIRTQFTHTYNYDKDPNRSYRISGFMAPGYLALGPGVMWRKNKRFYINMAPISTKAIYLLDDVYTYDKSSGTFLNSKETEVYGVEPGNTARYKLGFYSTGYLKFKLLENVHLENVLSLYSNYLDKPENIDVDYTLNMTLKINDILSSKLVFQTRYDDDAFSGTQFRESFGVGFNFKI